MVQFNSLLTDMLDAATRQASWADLVALMAAASYGAIWMQSKQKHPLYYLWFEQPQAQLTSSATETAEKDISKHMSEIGSKIVIFYGTQTGTTQRLAQTLAGSIDQRFSQKVCVASLADYDASSITSIDRDAVVIFILSTYGEGDPPENAYAFGDWLRVDLTKGSLSGLRFAILGVGSSNYKYYNQFSRTAFDALCKADASPAVDLCLADDAQGMVDEGYFIWSMKLFDCLKTAMGMPEDIRPYRPFLGIKPCADDPSADLTRSSSIINMYAPIQQDIQARSGVSPLRQLPISNARLLVQETDSARAFVHLEVDISSHPYLKYVTGDHLAIWPENPSSEIDALFQQLGISHQQASELVRIVKTSDDGPIWHPVWDNPVSLQALFRVHMDIGAAVSRELIQSLIEFAPSSSAADFLRSISGDETEYRRYRASRSLSLAALLKDASPDKTWGIPVSFILERVPLIRPRYYSISSASSVQPRRISITVQVKSDILCHNSSRGRVLRGLASYYLYSHCVDSSNINNDNTQALEAPSLQSPGLWCHLRRSKFKLPMTMARPTLMIATGSGIAPFRGFIHHGLKQLKLGHNVGQMILIFGCRNPEEHLYKEELHAAEETTVLKNGTGNGKEQSTKILSTIAAYSRFGKRPSHIQDKVRDNGAMVKDLILRQEANVYICGSTAMAASVREAIKEAICQHEGWDANQFASFEFSAKRSRRWQEDVWG